MNYIAVNKETNGYALFEDENNANKRYIYELNLSTSNIYNRLKGDRSKFSIQIE